MESTRQNLDAAPVVHVQVQEQGPAVHFVSLGMVFLDELHFPDGTILPESLGGSGAWATSGARLVAGSTCANNIACLIRAGHDFPRDVAKRFQSWGLQLHVHVDSARPSTRGLLQYHDRAFGRKSFRYLTEPLLPDPSYLPPAFLASSSFHFLLKPGDFAAQTSQLVNLRQQRAVGLGGSSASPSPSVILWEPFPALCTPENLQDHLEACSTSPVDIFSPNHLELLSVCGGNFSSPSTSPSPLHGDQSFDRNAVENCAKVFLDAMLKQQQQDGDTRPRRHHDRLLPPAVVVRAGEHGCLILSRHLCTWLEPYFTVSSDVIDATGAGNTFLGGLAVALVQQQEQQQQQQQQQKEDYNNNNNKSPVVIDLVEAAIKATVAASFAIEQISLPIMTPSSSPSDDTSAAGEEMWNGSTFAQRLQLYRSRCDAKCKG